MALTGCAGQGCSASAPRVGTLALAVGANNLGHRATPKGDPQRHRRAAVGFQSCRRPDVLGDKDQLRSALRRWQSGAAFPTFEPSQPIHSMTSSARASSVYGSVKPSSVAVLRLMTSSNFVGCSTGRSAALAPFKILST